MRERKSVLQSFGGGKGVILLVVGFSLVIGYESWQRIGSGSAMEEVARDLGLQIDTEGRRHQLRGRIDGIGVAVDMTSERTGGTTGNVRDFTRFRLYAPGAPPGKIVGASLRQRAIGGLTGAERIATGDDAFDEEVFVIGPVGTMLAHLDAEARTAIRAATNAGWSLEAGTWEAHESGLVTDPDTIRRLLDLGLAAARAVRFEGDVETALRERAESDPVAGIQATATAALGPTSAEEPAKQRTTATDNGVPMSPEQARDVLNRADPGHGLEAALVLADSGDDRQAVRDALIFALINRERQAQAIEALGKIGGLVEAAALNTVKGEHQAAAEAAIEAIRARQ